LRKEIQIHKRDAHRVATFVFKGTISMLTLTGKNIYLRALEPEDLEFVYAVENDETVWQVSNTQTPYSRFLIKQYLENAQQDITKPGNCDSPSVNTAPQGDWIG
jgi:hypothetical protein